MPMPVFKDRFAARFFPLYDLPSNASILDVYSNIEEYEKEKNDIINIIKGGLYEDIINETPGLIERMKRLRYGLIHELYNCKAIIAGSFILDVLYDTNYHNDIDIYDNANPHKKYKSRGIFTYKNKYLKFAQFLSVL
jgi:hypothetical protein